MRRGHRGALIAGRQAEAADRAAGVGELVDVAPGAGTGAAVGRVLGDVGVGSTAGSDEDQARSGVRVVGQAPVFGGRSDGDHAARLGRVGDRALGLVARRGRHHDALAMRVADRVEDLGDL